ncbi:MAG: 50S ribosome-binding GTPase [Clostridia bacterium]|nr:50S ribosome-binding GTPase [Clostridia bacterium]
MADERVMFDNLAEEINSMNDIPEDVKQKLLANIMKAKDQPVNILITGPTGCGKSSTINAMFNMEVAKVGVGVDPETMEIQEYRLGNLRIYDSPGLGDGKERDIAHAKKITELLNQRDSDGNALIDLVLVIVDGSTRDLGTTYELIENVIIPALADESDKRLLIAVNQADVAMKGKHWDHVNCRPDKVLTEFLNDKVRSIKERILKNTGVHVEPVFYSAGYKEEGEAQTPPYNLSKLMLYILKAIPPKKRLVLIEQSNKNEDMWKKSDELENYQSEIRNSLSESVCEGIAVGSSIGGNIGGAVGSVFGVVGEKVGKVVGTVVGGVIGFIGGLFSGFSGFF